MRVAADGGEPQLLFNVSDGTPFDVQMLPDGETVLFGLARDILNRVSSVALDEEQVVVQSLKSGQRKTVIASGSAPRYLTTGHLVYAREGVLFTKRFDLGRLEAIGEEVPIVEATPFERNDEPRKAQAQGPRPEPRAPSPESRNIERRHPDYAKLTQ